MSELSAGGVGDLICPSCAAAITTADAFCESCGATLRAGATAAVVDADGGVAPAAASERSASAGGGAALQGATSRAVRRCAACGGEILDDGFCGTCGQRARSERDHWVEAPTEWLGGVCDKGIVHARNEDAMALGASADGTVGVLVVCDGVTTAPDSDRAALASARAACASLLDDQAARLGAAGHTIGAVVDDPDAGGEPISQAAVVERGAASLAAATAAAHAAAVGVARSLGNPAEPPSCTFVAALVSGQVLTVGWCGDSRAYWFPDHGSGEQVTVDHSLGTEMIRSGMSRVDAEAAPTSHTITRWLGADSVDSTPDIVSRRIETGGWLLVCSDGLWNYASSVPAMEAAMETAIGAATAAGGGGRPTAPQDVADALVSWANACGGHDNVTAALARVAPSLR